MGPWVDWHCTLPASSMERVLRVVTYNVHRFTLGGGVLSMIPSLKMLEPSVLCLNEVDTSRQNTSLDILAGALVHFLQIAQQYILSICERTWIVWYKTRFCSKPYAESLDMNHMEFFGHVRGHYGNAILSRFPITKTLHRVHLDGGSKSTCEQLCFYYDLWPDRYLFPA